MKRQKYHLKTLVSALALTLALAGPVFPGSGEGKSRECVLPAEAGPESPAFPIVTGRTGQRACP